MPHATEDEMMGDDEREAADTQSWLQNQGSEGYAYGQDAHDHDIDQSGKADDAIDYEDISDLDDLPDEEEAANPLPADEEAGASLEQYAKNLSSLPVQPPQPQTNGYHVDHDVKAQPSSDLFDEADDAHDLFGEHSSSPSQTFTAPSIHAHPPPQRPNGLALPTKSSLALPSLNTSYQRPMQQFSQQSAESMSPPSSFLGDGYSPAESESEDSTDEETLPEAQREQRRLFRDAKRRQAGESVLDGQRTIDMERFYSLFPRFEKNQNPNFIDLHPQRPVKWKGKAPLKAPRPLQPTKLSLDLLPDQEKSFRAPLLANKSGENQVQRDGLVYVNKGTVDQDDSDDDLAWSTIDEDERVGGVTIQDLAVICGDWDLPSLGSDTMSIANDAMLDGEWEAEDRARPIKKRRTDVLATDLTFSLQDPHLPFEQPERTTARLAKSVALDLNDPNLLLDDIKPQHRRRRMTGDARRTGAINRSIAKRYNISNDEAYDLLKENHQHKVRSTLGSMTTEHSLPATKLQYPFYKVNLDSKVKRSFHRPHLDIRDGKNREFKFQKTKHVKRKHIKGREIKDLFAKAEDLYLGDNASVILLEYSEEAPIAMSNFGMGNRLFNYYRKRDADDQERPKRDIGETHVLLTQDKSPFVNFGHVDGGEVVPTIHNAMYRAPVFAHKAKSTDFLVGVSSTYNSGHRFYLRNVENLHTVGQQFPLSEVPGKHSRKVTDAAKKRLRAISHRMYNKSVDPTKRNAKALTNENIMPHLPGHDMPQTRSKMREFMKYERAAGKDGNGVWVPMPGQAVPDKETMRSWIKPEEICLLDSMQVGVQHLSDLGLGDGKDDDEDKDIEESANIELQLAPWQITKNFLNATQGKAMLQLHGEGDPSGHGLAFSMVKTSMKGGFQALGESVEDKIQEKKRKETSGHSYNVAKQQKLYDDNIRMIWNRQKETLSAEIENSGSENEDDVDEPQSGFPFGRAGTPRSSFGTPAFSRLDDDSASQFSRGSADRGNKALIITRRTIDKYGKPTTTHEKVTNPRVIAQYRKRKYNQQINTSSILELNPTGDDELDALKRKKLEDELARIERNRERRVARDKAKGRPSSPGAASPGPSDVDGGNSNTDGTPQKSGRGRNKDGTARKCANCGQVGHIKTNRKSVKAPIISFHCLLCGCDQYTELSGKGRNNTGIGGGRKSAVPVVPGNVSAPAGSSFVDDSYSKFTL